MGKPKKTTTEHRQVRISNAAFQNIDEIINYIAFKRRQPLNAVRVSEAFEKTMDKIAGNPFSYKECRQLQTKTKIYRQAVCMSWLIIYKITPNELLILSIIHDAGKPSRLRKLRKIR